MFESTLIIRPNKLPLTLTGLGSLGIFISLGLLGAFLLLGNLSIIFRQELLTLLGVLSFLLLWLSFGVFGLYCLSIWLPKAGELELAPEGLTFHRLWASKQFYRWRDISYFSIQRWGKGHSIRITFDPPLTEKRFTTLPYKDYSYGQLTKLLNEWVSKYNPSSLRFKQESSYSEGLSYFIDIAGYLFTAFSVWILYLSFTWLFNSTTIVITNNQDTALTDFRIKTFSVYIPERQDRFSLGDIPPQRKKYIALPNTSVKHITLIFTPPSGKQECFLFKRQYCAWQTGDTFSFEEDGSIKVDPKGRCNTARRSEYQLPEDSVWVASCPLNQTFDAKRLNFVLANPPTPNPEPDLIGPFIGDMQRKIKANWIKPNYDKDATIRVRFNVTRNGNIRDLELLQSSGDQALDESALRAVEAADPLPPLPESLSKAPFIPVQFTFDYDVDHPPR